MRWLCLSFLLIPQLVSAAVTINEVAWMGDSTSANYEWIELYNDGSAVSVDDWILSDGMNLSITLTGTIPGSSYAVLERTSEVSAPGTAFLIYTGALVNSGATLSLRRADGGLEDQIAGGENWANIGGDNTTKETAQYTTSGWITAQATPGAANKTEDSGSSDDTTTATTRSSGSSGPPAKRHESSGTVRLELPPNELELTIDGQSIGYVNQEIAFTAEASGVGPTIENSLQYEWNFGEGSDAQGKAVTHRFAFPGTYVVVAYANYKRQEQAARHEITILPVKLSLSRNSAGDLQINNDAQYEIDVSGFVVEGSTDFRFAPRSIMLPQQTVTLSGSAVGGNAYLYDQTGFLLASEQEAAAPAIAAVAARPTPTTPLVATAIAAETPESATPMKEEPEQIEDIASATPMLIQINDETRQNRQPAQTSFERWHIAALLSLIILGIGGAVYRKA